MLNKINLAISLLTASANAIPKILKSWQQYKKLKKLNKQHKKQRKQLNKKPKHYNSTKY